MIIPIKKLHENALVPVFQSKGAAGFDFHASESVIVESGATVLIPTGLAMEIPRGYELQIRPRSGLSAKTKVRVALGTVDSDYRGEIKIIMDNIGFTPFWVNSGDRVAQGVIAECFQADFELVEKLAETERGENGFGSSGEK